MAVLLSSCAANPTSDQIRGGDFGTYPSEYESIIKTYMADVLKDPESARYKFIQPPKKSYRTYRGFVDTTFTYCYTVIAEVNAKNSFGGYTGSKPWTFWLRNGQVIDSFDGIAANLNIIE